WAAGTGRKYWQVFLAAVALAAVTLTNWVAGLALAFCFAVLFLVCLWGSLLGPQPTHQKPFQISRALAAAGLAYLFAGLWLTPRFLKTVAFNWPADAFNYHLRGQQALLLAGLIAGLLLIRLLFLKLPSESYLCVLALAFLGFAYIVLIYYKYSLDTIPE